MANNSDQFVLKFLTIYTIFCLILDVNIIHFLINLFNICDRIVDILLRLFFLFSILFFFLVYFSILLLGHLFLLVFLLFGNLFLLFVFCDNMVCNVVLHGQHVWELQPIIMFDSPHSIEIKSKSVQVKNQCVWEALNRVSSLEIDSLIAGIALIVGNSFAGAELSKTVVDRLAILNLQSQAREGLSTLSNIAAIHTGVYQTCFTTKDILVKVLLRRILK